MDNATHLGLDVHKETIAVAVLRPGEAEPDERTIANTPEALRALIRRGSFEHPVACYEAGPTGYETHRLLSALRVACDVVAPTMIPRRAGARVKTDRPSNSCSGKRWFSLGSASSGLDPGLSAAILSPSLLRAIKAPLLRVVDRSDRSVWRG